MNIESIPRPDQFDLVAKWFTEQGHSVLEKPKPNENGVDLYVVGKKKTLRVEIKTCRQLENGSWQVGVVEETQKNNDCVVVVLPTGGVVVESMLDYLSKCSESGYRTFTWLKL